VFQGRFKSPVVDADDPDYFTTVCDYVHLNPVRAKMLNPKKPDLARYPWSSYGAFLRQPKYRPPWLLSGRLFASLLRAPDTAGARQKLRTYMKQRTEDILSGRAKDLEKEWKKIRRSWYYGDDTFKEKMVGLLDEAIGENKRESYGGEEKFLHDATRASRLIADACRLFDLTRKELRALPKVDKRKQAIVWLLKTRTQVQNAWISEHLEMGSRTNIFRAVRLFNTSRAKAVRAIKKEISKVNEWVTWQWLPVEEEHTTGV
jgi:hypothetical protein